MRRILPTLAVLLLLAVPALGRVEEKTGYSKEQAFNAALRYLRVDRGYRILEKDSDSGYLLFDYPTDTEHTAQGSIEVVPLENGVSVVVRIPKLPEYHERHLFRGLLQKLRSDYGEKRFREIKPEEKAPDDAKPKDPTDKDDKKPSGDAKDQPSESSKPKAQP